MKKNSHILLGMLTALTFNVPLTACVIGSLSPDIDVKWTKNQSSLLSAHRGITHHLIVALFLIFFSFVLENEWIKGFIYGYLSHLFGDLMTKTGIPYWKHKDRLALKIFKTGSIEEYIFVYSLIVVIFAVLFLTSGYTAFIPFEVQSFLNIQFPHP